MRPVALAGERSRSWSTRNETVSPSTRKRHGCMLFSDGAMRAASRMRSMWDGMGGLESGKTPQGKHAHRKMSRMQTKPIWVQSTQAWPTVPGGRFSGQFTFDAVVWQTLFASQQPRSEDHRV